MDKGLSVLALRKYDLVEEADDGADICETVFEFHKDVRGKSNLAFHREDKKDLYRYFISVDNLHRDVCGEELSTCETIRTETETSVKVAFRRVPNTDNDVLYVFTCPLHFFTDNKDEEVSFRTLSESAFTILSSCGIGAEPQGGVNHHGHMEARDMPDAGDWLDLYFRQHFSSSSFLLPVFAYSSAHRNAEVRNIIVHHFLQSSCRPFFFTAFDLHFTVFSRQENGSLRIVYSDDLEDCLLPWLLCSTHLSDDTLVSSSSDKQAKGDRMMIRIKDCFVKVCETRSLCLCLQCPTHSEYFSQVISKANWGWITRGIEAMCEAIVVDLGKMPRLKGILAAATLRRYAGSGTFD